MNEEQFISANSSTWRELENLSEKISKKGLRSLPSYEAKKFLHIFRQSSHHLAYARTHYPHSSLVNYLNSLIGKSHSHIYAVKKFSPGQLVKYIGYDFPKLLKEYKWYVSGAFGFFAFGALLALALVFYNVDYANLFMDPAMVEGVKSGASGGGGDWNYPLMSSTIMVNNISVSLRAFILGITLGLGTIYVLFFNGALLGALTALIYMYGKPVDYWSLILPHGVIELTAIFVSGAAGLIIARGMLLPGELKWGHSLINSAKKAAKLIVGIVFMLITAGIIEGFYTPLQIPAWSKLLFAGVTALVLAIYFSVPYIIKK